jgi:hypothetical protein
MKKSIDTVNNSISKLSASLSDTDISLANTEAQLEMIGSGMSDPKPLVEAREAKQNLTKDRKDIRAKTVLLRYELLQGYKRIKKL